MYTHHPLTERELGSAHSRVEAGESRVEKLAGDVVAAGYLVLAALLTLTVVGISTLAF